MTVRARQLARRCRERLAAQLELTAVNSAPQQQPKAGTTTKPESGKAVR